MPRQKYPQKIIMSFDYDFTTSKDGLYAISIIAKCRSGKQIGKRGGEDLRVEIIPNKDETKLIKLRELPPIAKPQYKDIASSWNGTKLKGLKKTVMFLLRLKKGEHSLRFIPYEGAVMEQEPEVKFIKDSSLVSFDIQEQAQDGNCRPWYSFVLINTPLKNITADVTCNWRIGDDDDVKLIIDGEIQKNSSFTILHKNWAWSANILKKLQGKGRETKTFQINQPRDLHSLEFWADKTPTLHKVTLNLKKVDKIQPQGEKAKVVWTSTRLRKEPTLNDKNILVEDVKRGEEVIILERAEKGERPVVNEKGVLGSSNRWHKVNYKDQTGYIYSEALEVDGESKGEMQKMIIAMAKAVDCDSEILLALAECESHFFPYTVSYDEDHPDIEIAFGVMQLSEDLVTDLNDDKKPYYCLINDVFDARQNIQAGITYFQYLYNLYDGDQERLQKSIAAYNSGPGDVDIDDPLNLELFEDQTSRLVNCVVKHLKRKTFKKIAKFSGKILLAVIVLLGSLGIISYLRPAQQRISLGQDILQQADEGGLGGKVLGDQIGETNWRETTLYFCQNTIQNNVCNLQPVARRFKAKEWGDYDAKYDNVVYDILAGPSREEQRQGFVTSFPKEAKDLFQGESNNRISFNENWSKYNKYPIQTLENQLDQLKTVLKEHHWPSVDEIKISFAEDEGLMERRDSKWDKEEITYYLRFGSLPEQYEDYYVIEQKEIVEPLGRLVIINNNREGLSIGFSKLIFIKESGEVIELPGWGEGFNWWRVGDFNGNGAVEVAVMYENSGSGVYNPFYLYEWNGESFEIKVENKDGGNWDKLVDLDGDDIMEVVHTWSIDKWGPGWREVFAWDKERQKYVKANHQFPQIYKEWLEQRGYIMTEDEFLAETSEGLRPLIPREISELGLRAILGACLFDKVMLNVQGSFADIDGCTDAFWEKMLNR